MCIQPYQTTGWCLHISHILMLGLHPGQYSEKLDIVTLDIFFSQNSSDDSNVQTK